MQLLPAPHIASLILLSVFCACSGEKSNTQNAAMAGKTESSANPTAGCDGSLWNHVYDPARLQQLAPCLSVTGVIDESDVDPDGDQHLLLRLDPGQDTLVNKRNAKKKGGDIVVEIVCANPTAMKKARSACASYKNSISIPTVGAHVRVTGTYVIDSHNGWAEIHPVSRIQGM
jgi:hypothetical protein